MTEYDWLANYLFNRNQIVSADIRCTTRAHPWTFAVSSVFSTTFHIPFKNVAVLCMQMTLVVYVDNVKKEKVEDFINEEYLNENELFINLRKKKTEAMIFRYWEETFQNQQKPQCLFS